MAKSNEYMHKTPGVKLRRIRQPGDMATLKRKLWSAVLAAEDLLFSGDALYEEQIRAVHALVQAAQAYGKLLETAELEARIAALEERDLQRQPGGHLRRAI